MTVRFLLVTLLLAACAGGGKNYDASAKCQGMGYKPGTAEYDDCLSDEQAAKAMQQQREEFEMMKQYQQDQKLMRY